jgi:hypothetical protein
MFKANFIMIDNELEWHSPTISKQDATVCNILLVFCGAFIACPIVMKFVSYLRNAGGLFWAFRFSLPNKMTATI